MTNKSDIDPTNLKRQREWSFQEIVFCLAASNDAGRLWFGASDAGVYELDLTVEKPERKKLDGEGHSSYVTGMARVDDVLVTCGYDRQLIWWDLKSGSQRKKTTAHDRWIRQVILTPDGNRLISVADDMRCRIWDLQTGDMVADFSDHLEQTPHHYPSMLYAVAVSDDGSLIATGDRIGHVAIWDAHTFEKLSELEAPEMYTWDPRQRRHSIGGIRSLAFSPDGKRLAVGGMGKVGNIDHLDGPSRLEIFQTDSSERTVLAEDKKNKGLIEQIHWSTGGDWLLTAGGANNGFLAVYESSGGKQLHATEHGGHVHCMGRTPDSEQVFLGGHQRISHWAFTEAS